MISQSAAQPAPLGDSVWPGKQLKRRAGLHEAIELRSGRPSLAG